MCRFIKKKKTENGKPPSKSVLATAAAVVREERPGKWVVEKEEEKVGRHERGNISRFASASQPASQQRSEFVV